MSAPRPAWKPHPLPFPLQPEFAGHALAWDTADFSDASEAVTAAEAELTRAGLSLPSALRSAAPKRRIDYCLGRLCAVQALRELGHSQLPAGTLESRADRSPVWPSGFTGSITHCEGFVWALVARDPKGGLGVGIDSENIARGLRASPEIRRQILSPEEESAWKGCPLDSAIATLLAFSAKESVYKALAPQVGRFFGFEAFRIIRITPSLSSSQEGWIEGHLTQELSPRFKMGLGLKIAFQISPSHLHTSLIFR